MMKLSVTRVKKAFQVNVWMRQVYQRSLSIHGLLSHRMVVAPPVLNDCSLAHCHILDLLHSGSAIGWFRPLLILSDPLRYPLLHDLLKRSRWLWVNSGNNLLTLPRLISSVLRRLLYNRWWLPTLSPCVLLVIVDTLSGVELCGHEVLPRFLGVEADHDLIPQVCNRLVTFLWLTRQLSL